jgi:NAD(P)-dependent dehydrogenase (short-subunit alcohol dehydrogenase family)
MIKATLESLGDAIAAPAPMERSGTPSDVAELAIFLASPAAGCITGAVDCR